MKKAVLDIKYVYITICNTDVCFYACGCVRTYIFKLHFICTSVYIKCRHFGFLNFEGRVFI